MNSYSNVFNAKYYVNIDDVPIEIWNELGCTQNLYFNPNYLSAIANSHPNIEFWYVVLYNHEQTPIAFATIQIVDFYLESIQNELQGMVGKIKNMGRKLGILSKRKPFKILTCGNTFVSGEHGIVIKNNQNKQEVIKALAKSVVHLANNKKHITYKISGFMLKDFIHESLLITDELLEYNYHSFNVEPNMLMQIQTQWTNFSDYLAALKTKFRVKAKKALERSFPLEIVKITPYNFYQYAEEMERLYKNVSGKAGFNLGTFNVAAYKSLKENLKDDYIIQVYLLNHKVVGFLSAMINKKSLDAHFVGIDYKYNKEFAIYQRMLYDYIELAIDKKLEQINFGRTASEIKSSVGAKPQHLTIYLRHKHQIPNKLLRFFLYKIQPTPFHQKYPFKSKTLAAHKLK